MTDIIASTKRGLKKGKYKVFEDGPPYARREIIQVEDPDGDYIYVYKFVDMFMK